MGDFARGGGTDMTTTREEFETLTAQLLSSLGTATVKKTLQQVTLKAQVAVDIVIRNLFERTADIGFLATDDDLRYFLRNRSSGENFVERLASVPKSNPRVAGVRMFQGKVILVLSPHKLLGQGSPKAPHDR